MNKKREKMWLTTVVDWNTPRQVKHFQVRIVVDNHGDPIISEVLRFTETKIDHVGKRRNHVIAHSFHMSCYKFDQLWQLKTELFLKFQHFSIYLFFLN